MFLFDHPYLFLGTLLFVAIISYVLYETRGTFAYSKRVILGSLLMLFALLLQHTAIIDGFANNFGSLQEQPQSVTTLYTLCDDVNARPVKVFGLDADEGCAGAMFVYWFNYLLLIIGLFSLIHGLVHINT